MILLFMLQLLQMMKLSLKVVSLPQWMLIPWFQGTPRYQIQHVHILEKDVSGDTEADTSDVRPEETYAFSMLYRAGYTSVRREG